MSSPPHMPRRPAIPPTFYALVATILGMRATLSDGGGLTASWVPRALMVACAALVVAGLVCKRTHAVSLVLVMIGVSLATGTLLASLLLWRGSDFARDLAASAVSDWDLRIRTDPVCRDDVYRCRATMTRAGHLAGDVWLTLPEPVAIGFVVNGVGRFAANADDEWGRASRMQGIWGNVRIMRTQTTKPESAPLAMLSEIRARCLEAIEPHASAERALLAGCTCGWRRDLVAYGLDESFARCGLAHLVAVSGSHLAILASLVGIVLSSLNIRPRARACALVGTCALFVAICGSPLSAVRSWIMTCSSLLAAIVGRRAHALSGVCVAGLAIVLIDPAASGQVGFLLSVVSLGGLCLFAPYASYCIQVLAHHEPLRMLPRRIRHLAKVGGKVTCETLAASIVAQVVTFPIAMDTFGEFSLVGPLASLVVTAPFGLLVGMGMVALLLGWAPPLQHALLVACDVLGSVILGIVDAVSSLPFARVSASARASEVSMAIVVLHLVLVMWWPRLSRARVLGLAGGVALLACLVHVGWCGLAPARVCVLDVGQGDAILVQDGSNAVLIDTGPGDAVVAALARHNVVHLDAVILTHLHDDHCGGIEALAKSIPCEKIVVAQGVASGMQAQLAGLCTELAAQGVEEVGFGDVIHVGAFEMRVVWPHGTVDGNDNEDSLELVATYDVGERELSALFTGDAERDQMAELISGGLVGDIDMLKVGHHGSEVSITAEQARDIDPEVSVASAGKNNRYGHPTQECIDALEEAGSVVLCTKDAGDVEVQPGAEGPRVTTQR